MERRSYGYKTIEKTGEMGDRPDSTDIDRVDAAMTMG
jgi:hypothetical protein